MATPLATIENGELWVKIRGANKESIEDVIDQMKEANIDASFIDQGLIKKHLTELEKFKKIQQKRIEYRKRPEVREKRLKYNAREDVKKKRKEYAAQESVKNRKKELSRARRLILREIQNQEPEIYMKYKTKHMEDFAQALNDKYSDGKEHTEPN